MTDDDTTISATLEDELLLVLSRQARRVPFPVLLVASIIAIPAGKYLPPVMWGTWLAMVVGMQVVRIVVLPRLPEATQFPLRQRLALASSLSFINGCVLASSLYAFPLFTELERAVQTMLLSGLAAGTVVSSAGYRPIFFAFVFPIIVPMFLLWAVNAGGTGIGWDNLSVAALVVLFGAFLVAVSGDSFNLFSESFTMRLHHMKLNEQLRQALSKADASNKAKTRFLASASHDLRQPLHALSLYSAALLNRPLDDRSADIARHMKLALGALGTQLDALLDISRLDAGVVTANFETVDLRSLLDPLVSEFEASAQEKNLLLLLHAPDKLAVRTDSTLLRRVMANLLSNAIKYTDQGSITLRATPGGGRVGLSIADTGQGIPEEQRERVFEEFYQVGNPHRDRTQGFGLGLSIVKRMVRLLDIEMEMESQAGVGTTFFLALPHAEDESKTVPGASLDNANLAGLFILILDDEPEVRLGMKTLLESFGCEVALAESTSQAVAAVIARRPDLMLFDFRLRDDDDGLTTLAAVQAKWPDLPAIMISGDTAPERLREANAAGVQLLHKPVTGDELRVAIAAACGRTPSRDPPAIRTGAG